MLLNMERFICFGFWQDTDYILAMNIAFAEGNFFPQHLLLAVGGQYSASFCSILITQLFNFPQGYNGRRDVKHGIKGRNECDVRGVRFKQLQLPTSHKQASKTL
ncbi:hypothetical protein L1049_022981 [Liquidambar formosana]|uniref:Uncharacterized protein n=1 Tax=Liquidambar formosana TaxID=63359 RepID=A0AAP0RFD3_LIQFO